MHAAQTKESEEEMNPHAENLRVQIRGCFHCAGFDERCDDCKSIESAAAEIERLEAELSRARHELNSVGNLTSERLASLLIKRGVIQEAAISDPDGYDGGRTVDAINAVVAELKGQP